MRKLNIIAAGVGTVFTKREYQHNYYVANRARVLKRMHQQYSSKGDFSEEWKKANPTKWNQLRIKKREYNQKYYIQNKERLKEDIRQYVVKNREKKIEYNNLYYSIHRDEINRRRRTTEPKKIKKRYHSDEAFRTQMLLRNKLYWAFRLYGSGKQMPSNKYGINYKLIIEALGPRPSKEHVIDHIVPLSLFDFNDPEQIKKAFAPENHRWLTEKENCSRGGLNRPQIRKEFGIAQYDRPRTVRLGNDIMKYEEYIISNKEG